jgi:hypothetical protein
MPCYVVRCKVSYSCNLREHLNIWECLLRPRSTTYTEIVSKHALSPSRALFSYNYPRDEEKRRFMYCPTIAESDRSLCHACADFSEILCWGNFTKICRHIPFLVISGMEKRPGPALCANPHHYISATVNKRETPMG